MTDLVIYQAPINDRIRYAQTLSASSLLPGAYRGKEANVFLAVEMGAALGIAPMAAIQGIHVIDGKPTASAGLIGALVRKAGHKLRVTGNDELAVCTIIRADDPDFEFRAEWTMDRARQAGLTGKSVWKQYPAAMLKARAITECARDACPEALSGVSYTPEELGDDGSVREAYPQTSGAASEPHRQDDASAAPEPDIEDAVLVDDDVPAWVQHVAAATSLDELRAVWDAHHGDLDIDGRARLSHAMTARRDELDAEAETDDGAGEGGDPTTPPEAGQPLAPSSPPDNSGKATRTQLKDLSIALDAAGITDRQDVLDWTGATVGRVIASLNGLAKFEAAHAVQAAQALTREAASA